MLSNVLSGAVPAAVAIHTRPPALEHIFDRVKLNLVEFTARDIYQICTTVFNGDYIGMAQDPDFMRGLASAFARSDQTVLSPFQTSLIAETFRKVNINVSPKEVMVPVEEDAVSPEALLHVLRSMNITRMRDERKMAKCLKLMTTLLDEFSPSQLSLAIRELGTLRCTDANFMSKLAKRVLEASDDLGPMDISTCLRSLAMCPGVQHVVMWRMFRLAEERIGEFHPEDYINTLQALDAAGPKYIQTLRKLVEMGLENVENMDAETLTHFLMCFVTFQYARREHVEIFADSLVEVASDLSEKNLVITLTALNSLNLLSQPMFSTMATVASMYAKTMDPRNIALVMDVCSQVPHNSDFLMRALLDRAAECTRILNPNQLSDIAEIIGMYPPAREHPIVQLFGKQARLRVDIMGPEALSRVAKGLAQLGYVDSEFYLIVAEGGFRLGFKSWDMLEPIYMGLCMGGQCPPQMVRILSSHLAPMARTMSLAEIERANKYLMLLRCEDDFVYRALANRLTQFVKEVTPEMPQELHMLLQRGAVDPR